MANFTSEIHSPIVYRPIVYCPIKTFSWQCGSSDAVGRAHAELADPALGVVEVISSHYSSSYREATEGQHPWPVTVKPWIVATLLADVEGDPYWVTLCYDSALEFVSSMSAHSDGRLVSVFCGYPVEGKAWKTSSVCEVLIGRVGETAVGVVRDEQGAVLCPDSPNVPASQINDLASVCVLSRSYGLGGTAAPRDMGGGLNAMTDKAIRKNLAGRALLPASKDTV